MAPKRALSGAALRSQQKKQQRLESEAQVSSPGGRPRVRLSFKPVNRPRSPASASDEDDRSSLSSPSSRPPPSDIDDSVEDDDFVPEEEVVENGGGTSVGGEAGDSVAADGEELAGPRSAGEAPSQTPADDGAPVGLSGDDDLFIPATPGLDPSNLGPGLPSHFSSSAVATVTGFREAEGRLDRLVSCFRCLRHLATDPDHECCRPNSQRKCTRCARLGKACVMIPRRYRYAVKEMEESERGGGFSKRVLDLVGELDCHFRLKVRAKESTRALWSLNRNVFRLVNTLRSAQGWESLPAKDEEVEEEFFGGTIGGDEHKEDKQKRKE